MQAKNKIVHITSSLKTGGAERVLARLVTMPSFEHTVIYFHHGPFVQRIAEKGVKVVGIKGLFFRYDPVFFYRLFKALYKEDPTVIHALLWAANIVGRLCACVLRKPIVTAYHNNLEQDPPLRTIADKITMALSHKHIAVSDAVAQSIFARASWLPAESVEIIPNGVAQPVNSLRVQKTDLGLPDSVFVIGSVGRFVPLKNFDMLLEATALCMKQYAHIRLILVGVGPEEQRLRNVARKLDIADAVIFVVGQDATDYYSAFDCFVQCSDKEGISMALLEAMSYKVPCIVMGQAFRHPVIQHNLDGLVCVPRNKEMLAAYITLLMMHEREARALADKAALKISGMFNEQAMIDKYAKVFERLSLKNAK